MSTAIRNLPANDDELGSLQTMTDASGVLSPNKNLREQLTPQKIPSKWAKGAQTHCSSKSVEYPGGTPSVHQDWAIQLKMEKQDKMALIAFRPDDPDCPYNWSSVSIEGV